MTDRRKSTPMRSLRNELLLLQYEEDAKQLECGWDPTARRKDLEALRAVVLLRKLTTHARARILRRFGHDCVFSGVCDGVCQLAEQAVLDRVCAAPTPYVTFVWVVFGMRVPRTGLFLEV